MVEETEAKRMKLSGDTPPSINESTMDNGSVGSQSIETIRLEKVQKIYDEVRARYPDGFHSTKFLYVKIALNGHPALACVETGSKSTIIPLELAKKAGLESVMDTRIIRDVEGLAGTVYSCEFDIGGTQFEAKVDVMNNREEVSIGMDFIRRHKCNIDMTNNRLTFNENVHAEFLSGDDMKKFSSDMIRVRPIPIPNTVDNDSHESVDSHKNIDSHKEIEVALIHNPNLAVEHIPENMSESGAVAGLKKENSTETIKVHSKTLIDMPPEIITKIMELPTVLLEDRKNLRLACKPLKDVVASSNFTSSKIPLILMSIRRGNDQRITEVQVNKRLLDDGSNVEDVSIGDCVLLHLSGTAIHKSLFQSIRVNDLRLQYLDHQSTNIGKFPMDRCLEVITNYKCHFLHLMIYSRNFSSRLNELINKLTPEKVHVELHSLEKEVELDEETAPQIEMDMGCFLNLPTVKQLTILIRPVVACSSVAFSDSIILGLIDKCTDVTLDVGLIYLRPKTLIDIAKSIVKNGHHLRMKFIDISTITRMYEQLSIWNDELGRAGGSVEETESADLNEGDLDSYDFTCDFGDSQYFVIINHSEPEDPPSFCDNSSVVEIYRQHKKTNS